MLRFLLLEARTHLERCSVHPCIAALSLNSVILACTCRIQAEEEHRKEIGSLAHYKEWVNAWPHDTSKEAVQQHYELTGEDEPEQLLNMMHYETHGGYKHMMGSDICIDWVPLTMLRVKKKSNKVIFPLQLVPLCFSWQVRCNIFSLSKLTIHIVHFMSICDQRIKPVVVQLTKETIKSWCSDSNCHFMAYLVLKRWGVMFQTMHREPRVEPVHWRDIFNLNILVNLGVSDLCPESSFSSFGASMKLLFCVFHSLGDRPFISYHQSCTKDRMLRQTTEGLTFISL